MLVFDKNGSKGYFNNKSGTATVSQIGNGGKIPSIKRPDNDLINLPKSDVVCPFGFNQTGAMTSIFLENEKGTKESIIIQWGVNGKALALSHKAGEHERTVLKKAEDIAAFSKNILGLNTEGISKNVASRVASTFLIKIKESDIKAIMKKYPKATWYNEEYEIYRVLQKDNPDKFHIEITKENEESINDTINTLIEILQKNGNLDYFLEEIRKEQVLDLDKENHADYDFFIEEIQRGEINIDSDSFKIDFSPKTFAALENIPQNPKNSYERHQALIANSLPLLKDAKIQTVASGVTAAYSTSMGAFFIDQQMYRETQSFKNTQKIKGEKNSVLNIDKRLTSLYFDYQKAKNITSSMDRISAIKNIEEKMLGEKKIVAETLGDEYAKLLTLEKMKRERKSEAYHKAISTIAYAYQSKNGFDIDASIINSSFNSDALYALTNDSHIPYNAAMTLENTPQATIMIVLQKRTLQTVEQDGKKVLLEGQSIIPSKIISANFIAPISHKLQFHEKMATTMQKLSTLTAKGYKQAKIDENGELTTIIKKDTRDQISTLLAILGKEVKKEELKIVSAVNRKIHEKEILKSEAKSTFSEIKKNAPLLLGIEALGAALKKASLLEEEALNKTVKNIIKKPDALFAPIVSASLNTNITELYIANKEAQFIKQNQEEMNTMSHDIYEKIKKGTLEKDTEALSISASEGRDNQRNFYKAKIAIGIYKKVIEAFYISSKTKRQLQEQGEIAVGINKKEMSELALIYKAPEVAMLTAAISSLKGAVTGKNEKFQSYYIPIQKTNTSVQVKKEGERKIIKNGKEEKITFSYSTIEIKKSRQLNVILGKMKGITDGFKEEIAPVLEKIANKKFKSTTQLMAHALSDFLSEGEKVPSSVIEEAAKTETKEQSAKKELKVIEEITSVEVEDEEEKSKEAIEKEAKMMIENAKLELEALEDEAMDMGAIGVFDGEDIPDSLENEMAELEISMSEKEFLSEISLDDPFGGMDIGIEEDIHDMHMPKMT